MTGQGFSERLFMAVVIFAPVGLFVIHHGALKGLLRLKGAEKCF